MQRSSVRPQITDHDRLGMTLFLALMIHGIVILGISFSISNNAQSNTLPTLDIILVQTHNQTENDDARFLSQVSQLGGGEEEPDARPSDLFTAPSITADPGMAIQEETESHKAAQQEEESIDIVDQSDADIELFSDEDNLKPEEKTVLEQESQQMQQVARLAKELDDQVSYSAADVKVKYLNSSTREFTPAKYMHDWIKRVERVGNLNYPDQAKRDRLSGTLILNVIIDAEGRLVETDLRRSSGHKVLDDAALRIVQLAAPYPPFPEDLREIADVIHITRSWEFLNEGKVQSN